MSVTIHCQSVVVSMHIFCLSGFVCEFTFGQLSVGELSYNRNDNISKRHYEYIVNVKIRKDNLKKLSKTTNKQSAKNIETSSPEGNDRSPES